MPPLLSPHCNGPPVQLLTLLVGARFIAPATDGGYSAGKPSMFSKRPSIRSMYFEATPSIE